jgi:hypothetical protein
MKLPRIHLDQTGSLAGARNPMRKGGGCAPTVYL